MADNKKQEVDYSIFEKKSKITEQKEKANEIGVKLQSYIAAKSKELPYAKKRLLGEYFNILCSTIDCLTALESVLE